MMLGDPVSDQYSFISLQGASIAGKELRYAHAVLGSPSTTGSGGFVGQKGQPEVSLCFMESIKMLDQTFSPLFLPSRIHSAALFQGS